MVAGLYGRFGRKITRIAFTLGYLIQHRHGNIDWVTSHAKCTHLKLSLGRGPKLRQRIRNCSPRETIAKGSFAIRGEM